MKRGQQIQTTLSNFIKKKKRRDDTQHSSTSSDSSTSGKFKNWQDMYAYFPIILHKLNLDHYSLNKTCLFKNQLPKK